MPRHVIGNVPTSLQVDIHELRRLVFVDVVYASFFVVWKDEDHIKMESYDSQN